MKKTKYQLLSNRLHTLYIGLSSDLLFYIAICTVFLTSVKGLSDQQMSLVNTISPLACIILQYPSLLLIRKIGNTKSIRLGCFCGLLTVIICTFATNITLIIVSEILYQVSTMFKTMGSVILKNNLTIEGKENDFAVIQGSGLSIYSVITAIIALSSGFLYEINKFLPMYLAIASAFITLVLSFFIKDYGTEESNLTTDNKKHHNDKISMKLFSPLIICSFICSILFMSALGSMQNNSDLLRKNILEDNLGDVKAVKILSLLVFGARLVRILSCNLYKKFHDRIGNNIVPIMFITLFVAMSLIVIGGILPDNYIVQVIMISLGYCLILACRDPYTIFEEQTLLRNTDEKDNQKILTYISFARKIASLIIGAVMTSLIGIYKLNISLIFLYALVGIGSIICFVYFDLLKKYGKKSM